MKISSIKQQVKKPDRVSIFVDEKYSFSLSLDELVKYKLKNGDELDKTDIKKYKKLSDDGKLRARSLEWLLNRPHSTRELHDYLYHKKAEPDMIEALTKEFTDRGYLDDRKFAQWLVELQKRRNKSNRAIHAELFKKGIGRELADEVLQGSALQQGRALQEDEAERLKAVIVKKQKLTRYKNDPQKLTQYLVAQGFNWQLVKDQLANNEPES